MSVAPRIIHPCDHIIIDKNKEYGDILMTRNLNAGFPDKVPANISIIRIDQISSEDGLDEYSPGVDYRQKVSADIIEWANPSHNPSPGQSYKIRAAYIKTATRKCEFDNCDRCGGNGWYVGIFDQEEINIVSGEDKLAQDFIKILFTENIDGYGSDIKDVLAKNVYNEVELGLNISSSIEACAEIIKKSQMDQINNGCTVTLDEALNNIAIKEIIFVREEATCYVTIEIRSMSEKVISFSFMI